MKKNIALVFLLSFVCCVCFAADATFDNSTAASGGVGGALGSLFETIVLGVITVLGGALAMLIRFIMAKLEGSKTRNLLRIAGAAVNYAESKWGPDTGKGKEKEEAAVQFVMEHFKTVKRDQAEKFVKAAYSAIFTGLAPLGTTPAVKP